MSEHVEPDIERGGHPGDEVDTAALPQVVDTDAAGEADSDATSAAAAPPEHQPRTDAGRSLTVVPPPTASIDLTRLRTRLPAGAPDSGTPARPGADEVTDPLTPVSRTAPVPPQPEPEPPSQPSSATAGSPTVPAIGRGRRRTLLLAGAALTALAALAAAVLADRGGSQPPAVATPRASASAAREVPATLSSFDPAGGSGLQADQGEPGSWRTQTYRTARFGNLKPGVGLVLDLGRPTRVQEVSFVAGPGTIVVQLRAADEVLADPAGWRQLSPPAYAEAATTIRPDDPQQHRYWMVWISELAPVGGGYRATVADVRVRGA